MAFDEKEPKLPTQFQPKECGPHGRTVVSSFFQIHSSILFIYLFCDGGGGGGGGGAHMFQALR